MTAVQDPILAETLRPVAVPKQPLTKPVKSRLAFLDWTRGLAASIMLVGHTFHSFTRKDLQTAGPYVLSQFLGGLAPAIFLFLTGVTFGFLLFNREKQGLSTGDRIKAGLRRAGYLAMIAGLFRLQLWAFAWPQSPWTDLLKVDVLNCMAVACAVLSLLAVFPTRERAKYAAVVGCVVAAAGPVLSNSDLSGVPAILRAYLTPDFNTFSLFPWSAFVAFGVSIGSLLRLVPGEQLHRAMQWSALVGFGMFLLAQYASNLPYSFYANTDFWLNSPALVFMKLGLILIVVAFAFLWNQWSPDSWSWVRQLGTTSLLVYWVHIELVYGRWFGFWKQNLEIAQVAIFAAFLVVAMLGLSIARTRWPAIREALSFGPVSAPSRAAGN